MRLVSKKAVTKTAGIAAVVIVIVAVLGGAYWYLYLRAPPAPPAPETIKIGSVIALTGPAALFGAEKKIAMEILVEWINEGGGIYIEEYGKKLPVELIIEDEAGVPEKAVSATEKLILVDKVVGITGYGHSHCALATLPLYEEHGIPLTLHEVWSEFLTQKGVRNVFRVGSGAVPVVAEVYGGFAAQFGFKRPATLGEDTDFGIEGIKATTGKYREHGLEVYQSFIVSQFAKEYYPEMTSIKAAGCDLVEQWIFGRGNFAVTIQGHEIGLFPDQALVVWCDPGPTTPEFWESVGEAGIGVCFNYNWHNKTYPLCMQLREEYQSRTGRDATYMTHVAFDSLTVLLNGIERAGSLDSDDIVSAIEATKDLQVTGGTIEEFPGEEAKGTFWYHHWNALNVIWQWQGTVEDPKLEIVYPLEHATADLMMPGSW